MILSPITQLDAVNEIIGTLGESPIETLEDIDNVDAQNALRMLEAFTENFQARGWSFNRESNYVFYPDKITKHILWNNNILSVFMKCGRSVRKRGDYLYDITNGTDVFENPLVGEVILSIPFEEMPQVFKQYVTIHTARLFNARYLGDPNILQELQTEEKEAYAQFMEYEMELEKNNVLKNRYIQHTLHRG